MSLLLKSQKSEIKKFKNIETCKLNAILDNFHNFGTNLKIFSSLQHNFMKNRYHVQNLKIWWIHENSYVKKNFFRNFTKFYTSKYYVVHWAVSPELCFCLDLKNTFRLQKIWILDPVNTKSKSPLCACRPCSSEVHLTSILDSLLLLWDERSRKTWEFFMISTNDVHLMPCRCSWEEGGMPKPEMVSRLGKI